MVKVKDREREDRTTAMGLYTFAQSYLRAAERVVPVKLRHDAPKYFLYSHTMELALKAYLRATGTTMTELQRTGHGLLSLLAKARDKGLQDEQEEVNEAVIRLLERYGVNHEFRYIYTGPKRLPTLKDTHDTAARLLKAARAACVLGMANTTDRTRI